MYALWDRFGIKLKKLKALLKSALELLFAIVYNMYWYACYFAGCFVIGKFSSYNSSILRHALDVRVASFVRVALINKDKHLRHALGVRVASAKMH